MHEKREIDVFDDEISKLEALTEGVVTNLRVLANTLRLERNTRCTVNFIPADVMCTIYDFAVSDPDHLEMLPFRPLEIAQVCSTWRKIALMHPRMWSFIDLGRLPPECTDIYLQRSQGHPLTIVGHTTLEENAAWILSLIDSNLVRTQCLHVNGLTAHDAIWLRDRAAPLLEELRLSGVSEISTNMFTLGVATRRLRRLIISGAGITLACPMPRSLTTLQIDDSRSRTTLAHADACVSLLRELPHLVTLRLSLSARPSVPSQNLSLSGSTDKAPLSSLRHLTLLVPTAPFAVHLLSSLALPTLRRFTLTILEPGSVAHVLQPDVIPPQVICSLIASQLVMYSSKDIAFSNGPYCPPLSDVQPYFKLMWTPVEVFPLAIQPALTQLQRFYPFPTLRTLVLSGSP